jgi:hypothetical protein
MEVVHGTIIMCRAPVVGKMGLVATNVAVSRCLPLFLVFAFDNRLPVLAFSETQGRVRIEFGSWTEKNDMHRWT